MLSRMKRRGVDPSTDRDGYPPFIVSDYGCTSIPYPLLQAHVSCRHFLLITSSVNNIEYGRGIGGSSGSAREKAAKNALVALGVLRA
jgi:dsRNA-specific ribonuclease